MNDDNLKWAQWDSKWNDSFGENEIPIVHKWPIVLKINIISGSDINRNSILDHVDLPNPQIEVEFKTAKGKKKFQTDSIIDTVFPVWNEKFRFVLPDEQEHDDVLKFRLFVEDWYNSHVCIGEAEFNPRTLKVGQNFEDEISFGKAGKIKVKITKKQKSHIRLSLALNDKEMEFRRKRVPRVMAAMQQALGHGSPQNIFETPIMSIVGSGGGIRAMTAMCGVMDGLNEIGLQDCMTYAFGTSGSAWYFTGLYTRQAFEENKMESYHSWLRESFQTSGYWEMIKLPNMIKGLNMYKKKTKVGQPFTFVDYYGICATNKVIGKEYSKYKLSDIRNYVETAEVPYPILNTSQVQDFLDVKTYRADCTFSAYECEFPQYGMNINMQRLNSEFYSGVMERNLPEPDLSFIIGTLGSAFGLRLNRILGLESYEDMDNMLENFLDDVSETIGIDSSTSSEAKSKWEELKAWLSSLPQFIGRNRIIERTGKILNVARGFENMKRFRINPKAGDSGEIVDGFEEDEEILDLVDGGILCNVAIDAALRPQRRNDILFIADLTSYDADVGFGTLEASIRLAKKGGYKFPPIDLKKIKKQDTKEFYIFEDPNDPECPLVFWFLMSTRKFWKVRDYIPRNADVLQSIPDDKRFTDFHVYSSDTYNTIDLKYTNLEFDRLRELMTYNVTMNGEKIKQKIREKIAMKRRLNAAAVS
ncbi:cytosolic phospholipase A2-like [Styela clava]